MCTCSFSGMNLLDIDDTDEILNFFKTTPSLRSVSAGQHTPEALNERNLSFFL